MCLQTQRFEYVNLKNVLVAFVLVLYFVALSKQQGFRDSENSDLRRIFGIEGEMYESGENT